MIPQVFRDVDILGSLEQIVDRHTKHFKDDFTLDKDIIYKLALSSDDNDHHLIWLCRPMGTHCLREREVFLENTHENSVFRFYYEQTKDDVLAYALHLKESDGMIIRGDIFTLDYVKEVERLPFLCCSVERVTMYYPDGNEYTVPYQNMSGAVNELSIKHGDPESFRYHPESESELGLILRRLHFRRERQANFGDFAQHIEGLNKPSVRDKLQVAKTEVKPSERKAMKKDEQSL